MAANSIPSTEDDGGDMGVGGEEALERLRSADPPLYLSPSPELSRLARTASIHLFSSLLPFCPKTPFDRLLAGDGFDAEQIWGQIDSMSRPLVSMLRREMKRLERDPPSRISNGLLPAGDAAAGVDGAEEAEKGGDSFEAEMEDDDDEEEEATDEEEEADVEEEEDELEEEEAGDEKGSGIEDRFLNIKELEEYLEYDEAKEYGHPERRGRKEEEDGDKEAEEEEDDDEDDLEVRIFRLFDFF